jgi:ZIP family zinc transporter
MPILAQAVCWGLLAATGLVVGAAVAVAFRSRLSHRMIGTIMGFGGGVLIAVLTIDLMNTAYLEGGPRAAASGFLGGAVVFSAINRRLAGRGARHRNRCGDCVQQTTEGEVPGSGSAIAAGAVLDGIPESLVVGLSLLGGQKIGIGLVTGFFLANVPQGLSSAAGMKKAGRSNRYIFTVWTLLVVISGVAAGAGYLVLGSASAAIPAMLLAFAAGGVLAMLAESMIPEAFADAPPFIGVITVLGFLVAFLLIRLPS